MDAARWSRVRQLVESALERDAALRDAFIESACGEDVELLAEVRTLLCEDNTGDGWGEPPARAGIGGGAAGTRIGAYELRHEIGVGGMGAVHLAVRADAEFEKQVAIKILKRGMDSGELLARFRRERQVLAALEHPGIARLIDGGATEDGRPYIVMEYVEGQPIDTWCDEHRSTTRERIALFRKVCAAVQYAHQNLVVHRDLKPSNVLVTADGEPKLLDFGIAKLLDPTRPAITQDLTHGLRFMTPEYASPEQVRGRPVATPSDVYSLGAVLYQLLTGHVPHRFTTRSPLEIERAVCEEEPTRPSTAVSEERARAAGRDTTKRNLRRELAGDVDTIVMKALRKTPERRYASAEQLSEDLGRFLDGLPVLARPDSVGYRFGKFVRRNRLPVGATAALIVVLSAGLWNSDRLYREASEARTDEAQQRRVAEERTAEVERLNTDLDAERTLAQRRFDDVRGLATSFVFDVYDRLRHVPGTIEVREEIVRTAQEHLDTLAAESVDDRELQLELAEAYGRLGDSQGHPHLPSLGQTALALESYERALAIVERLADAGGDPRELARVRAYVHRAIADVRLKHAEFDAAIAGYRDAVASQRESLALWADEPRAARDLSRAEQGLAEALTAAGHYAEALEAYDRSAVAAEEGLVRWPGDGELARQLAAVLAASGNRLVEEERHDEAERRLRYALEVLAPLEEREPRHAGTRLRVAEANLHLAVSLADVPPVEDEARERILVAAELFAALSAEDPRDLTLRRSLGKALQRFGEQHCWSGEWVEGLEYCLRAEEIWNEVAGVDPDNLSDLRELAALRDRIGQIYYKLHRYDEAIAHLEQGRRFWQRLIAREPGNARTRHDLSVNGYYLAFPTSDRIPRDAPGEERIAAKRGAVDLFRESLDLLEGLQRDGLLRDSDLQNIQHLQEMIAKVERQIGEIEAEP
jgi:non-specific serine/threonine protein kinase/serine/threonine-protein kinase